jgi:hypothetical protein
LNLAPDITGGAQFGVRVVFWGHERAGGYWEIGSVQQKWLTYWTEVWWDGRIVLHEWGEDVCVQVLVGTQRKETAW